MTEKELKLRSKLFTVNVLKLVDELPYSRSVTIIANQLGRSASSVAANYRAACRARSHAEFISRIAIVEEEADESCFWLNVLAEILNTHSQKTLPLLAEARQLTAIFTASGKTAKSNRKS